MKQKDKGSLNEILEKLTSPICSVCHSKLDIEKLAHYFERKFPRERMDYEIASSFMEITNLLNSNLPLEVLIRKIIEVIKKCFHAQSVELLLFDKKTGILELNYHLEGQSIGKFFFDPEKHRGIEPFKEEVIFIPDIQKDPSFNYMDQAKKLTVRSIVAIPLIAKGKIWGIFCLSTPLFEQRESLLDEEKELLSTFGNLILVAMKMHNYIYYKIPSTL